MKEKKYPEKLLIATDCFLPRWDGIARFLSELIPKLSRDYKITVIAPKFKGKTFSYPGVKIIRIKTYNFQVGDYSPPKIKTKLIKKEVLKHDIIFAQTVGPIGAVAIFHGRRAQKKIISYIHSLEWELFSKSISENNTIKKSIHRITKVFVRRVYNKCNLLLVPSNDVRKIVESVGIKTEKAIVRLGVDSNKFKPAKSVAESKKRIGIAPKINVIGYAGRIGREKDLTTLIQAYKKIKSIRNDIKLLIIGSGVDIYEKDIKRLGIIRFKSKNNITDYLQAMDIFILSSHIETSSLATMEAMACGVVPITTGAGETKKYVKEGIQDINSGKLNITSW